MESLPAIDNARAKQCTEERAGLGDQEGGINVSTGARQPKRRYEESGSQASEWDEPYSVTLRLLAENEWHTQSRPLALRTIPPADVRPGFSPRCGADGGDRDPEWNVDGQPHRDQSSTTCHIPL